MCEHIDAFPLWIVCGSSRHRNRHMDVVCEIDCACRFDHTIFCHHHKVQKSYIITFLISHRNYWRIKHISNCHLASSGIEHTMCVVSITKRKHFATNSRKTKKITNALRMYGTKAKLFRFGLLLAKWATTQLKDKNWADHLLFLHFVSLCANFSIARRSIVFVFFFFWSAIEKAALEANAAHLSVS